MLERLRNRSRDSDYGSDRTAYGDERARLATARERQRDEYGGINWGAAFFGWLVAVGISALLTALLVAAGTAVAISEFSGVADASDSAEEITLGGGIALFVIALLAYFAGGYVAGRMSRFDGARQGLGVWLWAAVMVIILAVVGAIAGSEYNVYNALDLPRIPIDEGDLTTGGIIALIAVLVGTLLAAMAGGKAGEAYHRRVDAAGVTHRDHDRDVVGRDEQAVQERPPETRGGPRPAH